MVPRDPAFDSTLALLREGYAFLWNRCRRLRSDAFLTRLMGRRTLCLHGPEAAALFYDDARVQRRGAVPRPLGTSIFGKGALQTLDGDEHRRRKEAFLALMAPASLTRLAATTAAAWRDAVRRWEAAPEIVLFDEARQVLARGVCAWAGLPLPARDVARRARDLAAMVDAFGGGGPRLWRGKIARIRSEAWAAEWIRRVRRRFYTPRAETALHVMAHLRGGDGALLPPRLAAIELLNLLRPTVALCWWVAFAALALHQHPGERARLEGDPSGAYDALFVQEVRRWAPFTPFVGGRVRAPFRWQGARVRPGMRVLLDVWGANQDPRLWGDPEAFRPERFRERAFGAFDFIPQGGGPPAGHRCPGEWVTLDQLALAVHVLVRCVRYELAPGQDLGFDLARLPTRPRSGVVLRDVRATAALEGPSPPLPGTAAAEEAAAAGAPSPAPPAG